MPNQAISKISKIIVITVLIISVSVPIFVLNTPDTTTVPNQDTEPNLDENNTPPVSTPHEIEPEAQTKPEPENETNTLPTTSPSDILNDIYEPDNSFDQYSTISVTEGEQIQSRSLYPDGDVDYVRFFAETGEYSFFVNSTRITIDTTLYDSNKNVVKEGRPFGCENSLSLKILDAGYYFLKLESVASNSDIYTLFYEYAPLTVVELNEAINNGLVSILVTGRNLEEIDIEFTSNYDKDIVVRIKSGLLFNPQSSNVQSMVSISMRTITLKAYSNYSSTLYVACANMSLRTPSQSDSFIISQTQKPEDLTKLMGLTSFYPTSFRVKQFAIWTITDNPTRSGYVEIGWTAGHFSGPTNEELEKIESLFIEAGIQTQKYQVFNK